MKNIAFLVFSALIAGPLASADTAQTNTTAPEGAAVYFIAPEDGATVAGTFTVKFGLTGMGVAPAGTAIESTGHHHLLIDTDRLPDLSQPLPATDTVRHFGKGQTETQISLPPGKHTLQLVLGNQVHIPHNPPVISEKITIKVAE